MRWGDGRWRATDIIVEGVSLLAGAWLQRPAQREQVEARGPRYWETHQGIPQDRFRRPWAATGSPGSRSAAKIIGSGE
jgi:hypothetical protein